MEEADDGTGTTTTEETTVVTADATDPVVVAATDDAESGVDVLPAPVEDGDKAGREDEMLEASVEMAVTTTADAEEATTATLDDEPAIDKGDALEDPATVDALESEGVELLEAAVDAGVDNKDVSETPEVVKVGAIGAADSIETVEAPEGDAGTGETVMTSTVVLGVTSAGVEAAPERVEAAAELT